MKKFLVSIVAIIAIKGKAQDVNIAMKQASNLERKLKEDSALLKYKEVLAIEVIGWLIAYNKKYGKI